LFGDSIGAKSRLPMHQYPDPDPDYDRILALIIQGLVLQVNTRILNTHVLRVAGKIFA
jgi:hypothetical protein